MKSTIIFLGLALLSGFNIKANELQAQEVTIVNVEHNHQLSLNLADNSSLKFVKVDNIGDTAIFNPESVIKSTYNKPLKEVINEDKLVTDAQEEVYQPLCIEMSVLDKIQEDNQIIESNISEEVFPLDFEKINRMAGCIKIDLNNKAIPVDIKL